MMLPTAIGSLITAATALDLNACAQSPNGHRVDSLPYFDTQKSSLPCMYAANMRASTTHHNYFFYWLFPNPQTNPGSEQSDLASVPLVINMNGGPGSTSMNSLFTEAGPLRCSQQDPADLDSFAVTYEPELSWQSLGDLLFVDHPVGTGWSYGTHSPTSLPEVAQDFVTFLNNFYTEFPERRV